MPNVFQSVLKIHKATQSLSKSYRHPEVEITISMNLHHHAITLNERICDYLAISYPKLL
jgi:hypothetical protein